LRKEEISNSIVCSVLDIFVGKKGKQSRSHVAK